MTLSTAKLLVLFTGDENSSPSYRHHLALELVARLEPRTVDELCERVYPHEDGPAAALEALASAYADWRDHGGRTHKPPAEPFSNQVKWL